MLGIGIDGIAGKGIYRIFNQAGGEFTFTKACFGRFPAYLCGWFLVAAYLTNVPMNSTAIGLIVDGLDGTADILKWGFHYKIAGFDVWAGEVLLASEILILFEILNILGIEKAGIIQQGSKPAAFSVCRISF